MLPTKRLKAEKLRQPAKPGSVPFVVLPRSWMVRGRRIAQFAGVWSPTGTIPPGNCPKPAPMGLMGRRKGPEGDLSQRPTIGVDYIQRPFPTRQRRCPAPPGRLTLRQASRHSKLPAGYR
jgi:hypothetical protein